MNQRLALCRYVICCVLCFFCRCKNTGSATLDSNGIPGKLVIAMYASGDNGDLARGMAPLVTYLQKNLGMEVEVNYSTEYTAVIQSLRSKKAHIAYLSPFSYILAAQKHDITPIITLGENGKAVSYHSVIITNAHTGLKSMDDVKAQAKKLTLCFADPASTSGHLIPKAYLISIGLNPDYAFKETMFSGSHVASILAVSSGKVDLGCTTSEYGTDRLERQGIIKPGQIRVLWSSPPIVSSPIVVRNDLNKALAHKIQLIYLNLKKDAPAVFAAYLKLYHPNTSSLEYITVNDSLYDGLRKVASGIKDLQIMK